MKAEFDQFIGMFTEVFSDEYCDEVVKHYKYLEGMGQTVTRDETNNTPTIQIDDDAYVPVDEWDEQVRIHNFKINKSFIDGMNFCLDAYIKKYSALTLFKPISIQVNKIQKTNIGGGFHAWHAEHGAKDVSHRVLACMLFLNDVQNGGETEFLYQTKRVNAKKGTALIWPAGFSHVHRGNPPLSNPKYIITSWFEYV